jgi:hypothetical protein
MIMALLIAAFAMSAVPPTAHALFKLRLNDMASPGTIEKEIIDNVLGDFSSDEGTIIFWGSVGVFNVVATTGVSKPILGDLGHAQMDLNSITVTTGPGSGGTIKIDLTDTNFKIQTTPGFHVVSSIGGDAGTLKTNSLTYDSFFDPSNTEFNTAVPASYKSSLGPFVPSGGWGSGSFAGTTNKSIDINPLVGFALTQEVIVTLGANQAASFNATVHAGTPEPTTLILLGCGLVGMAAYGWRRKKKQSQ